MQDIWVYNEQRRPLEAAIIVRAFSTDQIAELVLMLHKKTDFKLSILKNKKELLKRKTFCDLYIVPLSFENSQKNGWLFEVTESFSRILIKKPVLFCPIIKKWQRVIIAESENDIDYGNESVMNYFLNFIGDNIGKKSPEKIASISLHSKNISEHLIGMEFFGILNASKLPKEEQEDSVLVVSTKAMAFSLKQNNINEIIQNWAGNIMVVPS